MKYLILMFKGFIIGIAKIIPGVSGAVLSISLGIYEKLLNILGHPFKLKYSDLKFLLFLLIGAAFGILIFCHFMKWLLNNYYFPTMLLFTGLIVGGMPEIFLEIKKKDFNIYNFIIFFISFILILCFTNLNSSSNSFNNHYFLMGSIESLTTIIPGISGTAIFMALGWYNNLLDTINNLLTFKAPFSTCFYFISGFIISTIFISKLLTYLLKKFKVQTYFSILGFMMGSLWTMVYDLIKINTSFSILFIGLILFILGIILSNKINTIFGKY